MRVDGKNRQIVGVVEDGPTNHLRERIERYFYFPFAENPDTLAAEVRAEARRADAAFTVTGMMTMRQHMFAARKSETVMASGGLALLGLVLAAAGLFGVTSYAVSRRMREFGLRVALGATGTDLRRQVLKRAAIEAAIGVPAGWAMAFAARHVLASTLFGVKATDPWVFAAASGLVMLVAVAATLRPAFTAARVDPMVALRYD